MIRGPILIEDHGIEDHGPSWQWPLPQVQRWRVSIASCKLHGLDPEAYLRDLFRVLAHGRTS